MPLVGVSIKAVGCWRKALEVTRTNNEGTHRLIQAAAELGAGELRGQALPPEQVERRRQTALELNLAEHLQTGFHGLWWTPEETALLGTMPDAEVAAQTGRTHAAVRGMRSRLGIPNPEAPGWTPEELALLGSLLDHEVAARTGRTLSAVVQKRVVLGISPFQGIRVWTAEEHELVRTSSPAEVATRTRRTLTAVYLRRSLLGVKGQRRSKL